jgi:hypothetical protein
VEPHLRERQVLEAWHEPHVHRYSLPQAIDPPPDL